MRRFTELFLALDATTGTRDKVDALVAYFASAPPDDAAWAAYFLTGRKLKRLVGTRDLVGAAIEATAIPTWLFDASYPSDESHGAHSADFSVVVRTNTVYRARYTVDGNHLINEDTDA